MSGRGMYAYATPSSSHPPLALMNDAIQQDNQVCHSTSGSRMVAVAQLKLAEGSNSSATSRTAKNVAMQSVARRSRNPPAMNRAEIRLRKHQ